MTRRQRTFLFLGLLLIFLAAAPFLILYSQGYRWDGEKKRFVQTGGFYLKTLPSRAQVYVDDILVAKTDFFFGSALVSNLLPASHRVRIEKEGHIPWVKTLPVRAGEVTQARYIILFPQEVRFQSVFEDVDSFLAAANENMLLLERKNPAGNAELLSWNADTNRTEVLFEANAGEELVSVVEAPEGKRFFITLRSGKQIKQLVFHEDDEGAPCPKINPCVVDLPPRQVFFVPDAANELFAAKSTDGAWSLEKISYPQKTPPAVVIKSLVAFTQDENDIIWLDEKGIVWKQSLIAKTKPVLIGALPPQREPAEKTLYEIFAKGDTILVLQDKQKILRWNGEDSFQELPLKGSVVRLSPGADKLAFFQGNTIRVHSLGDWDTVSLAALKKEISQMEWLNNHYLIAATEDEISAVEVDQRDAPNFALLGTFEHPEFFWSEQTKTLAVWSQGTLHVSEKLMR